MSHIFLAIILSTPLVSEYSSGEVDWINGVARVTVTASPNTNIRSSERATEQDARGIVALQIGLLAEAVPFDGETTAGDLISLGQPFSEELENGLLDAVGNWNVVEATYHTNGSIELVGELNLFEWFSPVSTFRAQATGDRPDVGGASTGIIIDTRGTDLKPSFSPVILGPNNSPVYSVEHMSPASSAVRSPVRWITDVVNGDVFTLVGDNPLIVIAEDIKDDNIVVSSSDAARLRAIGMGTRLLQEGRVVVLR